MRSSYRMLVDTKLRRESWSYHGAGSSNIAADVRDWVNLWGVSVPSKVRVFLWRLVQHSLPTFDVLDHRNMADTHHSVFMGDPTHGVMR